MTPQRGWSGIDAPRLSLTMVVRSRRVHRAAPHRTVGAGVLRARLRHRLLHRPLSRWPDHGDRALVVPRVVTPSGTKAYHPRWVRSRPGGAEASVGMCGSTDSRPAEVGRARNSANMRTKSQTHVASTRRKANKQTKMNVGMTRPPQAYVRVWHQQAATRKPVRTHSQCRRRCDQHRNWRRCEAAHRPVATGECIVP
jgi:hypothetical protein